MPDVRVLICGSRDLASPTPVDLVLNGYLAVGTPTVIEGRCPFGGADLYAETWATWNACPHEPFPADFDGLGKKAGPIRNQKMLDEGNPDVVWAFVNKPLSASRGTADMVRRARVAGIPTYVVEVL